MWITLIGEILVIPLIIIAIKQYNQIQSLLKEILRLGNSNDGLMEHYDERDLMKLPKRDNFCMACGTSVK